MISFALKGGEPGAAALETAAEAHIAPVPRISVQAFCETAETAAMMQAAAEDRRMIKAHLKAQMGGIAAAVEAYRNAPTPNVVVNESESRGAPNPFAAAGHDRDAIDQVKVHRALLPIRRSIVDIVSDL